VAQVVRVVTVLLLKVIARQSVTLQAVVAEVGELLVAKLEASLHRVQVVVAQTIPGLMAVAQYLESEAQAEMQ
jgi:phenylpyruvate tautomerase PptA (4-oxalocrotonate tautomerase family)